MSGKAKILSHSPRGLNLEPLLEDPPTLPALPPDAELELGVGQASLEHEQREHKRRGKKVRQ